WSLRLGGAREVAPSSTSTQATARPACFGAAAGDSRFVVARRTNRACAPSPEVAPVDRFRRAHRGAFPAVAPLPMEDRSEQVPNETHPTRGCRTQCCEVKP